MGQPFQRDVGLLEGHAAAGPPGRGAAPQSRLSLLDEPFSGLDVNAGLLFRTLLRLFVRDGGMILFSSHRFDIVERVCSRVVILHSGRIVAEASIDDLRGSLASGSLEDVFARVTHQEDYSAVAEKILTVVKS